MVFISPAAAHRLAKAQTLNLMMPTPSPALSLSIVLIDLWFLTGTVISISPRRQHILSEEDDTEHYLSIPATFQRICPDFHLSYLEPGV